jgi:hypothetical protein
MYYKTFEECLPQIDIEIRKRRKKWTLTAINWMDYDDVSQIIRIHIYKKWSLYNQSMPLAQWVNRVISNQMRNLIRNNYQSFARPCLRCALAQGDNLCSKYKTQNAECPLYAKWLKTKKIAYDIKLPVSIDGEGNKNNKKEVSNKPDDFSDLSKPIINLHAHMQLALKANEWKVYKLLYIDGIEENEAAIMMGFKTKEKGRTPGYKQIKNLKKAIMIKVKAALYSEEVDII